ncbi:MAG TPA: NAD(P)-binding protein [Puia sp.]|nr:NAD(P)-binding protein [Puia sp.]
MNPYDIVIIGSGIGGLVCGNILSREGYRVCVLEKNRQIGGCLQTYARDKIIFDSGVHYIGGLGEGQTLYQVFRYLGLVDQLRLLKLDEQVFDKIIIQGDDKEYVFAQGYDRFISGLVADFPEEEAAIRSYCEKIKEVCSRFPMYNLRAGGVYQEKVPVLEIDTKTYIESLTANPTLRAVLAGNNILYAGQPDKTPFYVHALVLNSFIESSWKCLDGGSQIARLLAKNIRESGGLICTQSEVKKIVEENGRVAYVELADGRRVFGETFISNIHPAKTMELTSSVQIKNAYRNRLTSLENSIAAFSLNLVLKKDSFPYFKHNYYYHKKGCIWTMADYTPENWPLGYALFSTPSRSSPAFASSLTIMTYMRFGEMQPWQHTFNTVTSAEERGEGYEQFKKNRAEKLLSLLDEKFPQLRDCIQTWYASTPLSYRDYIGTDDGSMYGIVKDYKNPVKTIIPARTKLPNLFLTGQNLNLHGILGTTISSLVTCSDLLGHDAFIEKIKNA